MDRASIIVLGIFAVAIIGIIIAIIALYQKQKKEDADFRVREKSGSKNYLIWVYRLYQKVPVLNRIYTKIKASVERSYPADVISINKKISEILLRVTIIGISGFGGSLLLGISDLYYVFCGFTLTIVVTNAYINYRLNKIDDTILKQFSDFLVKLRHHYHESAIIDMAIHDSLDELPYEIRLHIQKIYEIIISPEMNKEVEGYIGSEPNKFVLMFLSLCASVKEYGDKKLEGGSSLFLTDLNYLKEEVNNEIIGQRKNRMAFKSFPFIVLTPIAVMKPLQAWAEKNFEGVSDYYNGIAGIASLVAIFFICISAYLFVCVLRDTTGGEDKDTSIWSKLAAREPISTYITKVVNKNYTKYRRYNDMARGMGDRTGMKAFLMKQVGFSVIAFVVSLVIFISGTITTRYAVLNSWETAFAEDMTPSDEYTQAMRDTGEDFVHVYKNDKYTSDEEFRQKLITQIQDESQITNSEYAEKVADQVIAKLNTYQSTYFKWWQLLVALLVAVGAFYAPVIYLLFRQQIIDMRREEEVVRFQSIMLILMHINGTTLSIILEWMERFSFCFKESISECRINLPSGTQNALEDLKDQESFEPFKDFVDNLLSIDRVGVEKAFDEIQTDREYYMKKREEDRAENLEKKVTWARVIMYVPLFSTIIFYLMVPMAMYVFQMFTSMKDMM